MLVFEIFYIVMVSNCLNVSLCAKFEKTDIPLFKDLESSFLAALWTERELYCAEKCGQLTNCQSFLYTDTACYEEDMPNQYRGRYSKTYSGKTCLAWADLTPHLHSFTGADFPDGNLSVAKNYCRDPDNRNFLWCMTSENGHWEPCGVSKCGTVNSYIDDYCQQQASTPYYSGKVSVTNNGRQCQRWDRQSPHTHTYAINSFYVDGSVGAANNYCRDHIGNAFNALWCYTTNSGVRFESCDIRQCVDVVPLEKCYSGDNHYGYTGKWQYAANGVQCQRWDSQTPHSHTMTSSSLFPDATLSDAANYCRDPDGSGYLWCYTTDINVRFLSCGIPKCTNHIPCRQSAPHYYSGSRSTTYSGKTCQSWSVDTPHYTSYGAGSFLPEQLLSSTQNFCRDPDRRGYLWCFTTDPNTAIEPCDIALCQKEEGNCQLFSAAPSPPTPPSVRQGYRYYRRVG